jgi:hypothetical protein
MESATQQKLNSSNAVGLIKNLKPITYNIELTTYNGI